MPRLSAHLIGGIAVITASVFSCQRLKAGHETPIYCAADHYRDAVRDFETLVDRFRYISDCDERLVDDFERSTLRLESAARNCDRLDRLFECFAVTERLHFRVEAAIFHHGHYPPNHDLSHCWRRVSDAYRVLAREMHRLEHPPAIVHPQRYPSGSFYRSEYGPTFRPETFGARPALSPRSVRPTFGPAVSPLSIDIQRDPRAVTPTRRTLTPRDDLRAALIGALLQRVLD